MNWSAHGNVLDAPSSLTGHNQVGYQYANTFCELISHHVAKSANQRDRARQRRHCECGFNP